MHTLKLHSSIKNVPPRGGASIVESKDHIIMFGGVDRGQCSYQDLITYTKIVDSAQPAKVFERMSACDGDTPMPRSGHATVSYGKYLFLFGGIDFGEEAVFNDLYILNTGEMFTVLSYIF